MDPSRFALTLIVLLIVIGLGRLLLGTIGHTGDVMATLFVPPDRELGWPRGVQESDDPWAWRSGPATGSAGAASDHSAPGGGGGPASVPAESVSAGEPLVVPVAAVRRIGRPR